uniref:Putative dual scp protein n=1 Tax=Tabanus bromius TaxID=304241 RepID=A0A0K8TRK5_TABBR
MEVCCLKMASRCKPARPVLMDVSRIPTVSSSHDCGSLSRVVMVRKTDQRLINHKKPQGDPQCEVVTFETIQTYKGHKPDRTVVTKERRDLSNTTAIDVRKSPSVVRLMRRSVTPNSEGTSLGVSTNDVTYTDHRTANSTSSPIPGSAPLTNGTSKSQLSVRQKSPSPSIGKKSIYGDFELECLRAHNEFRARHGVPPLKLNRRLCKFAEEWAKVLASRGNPIHRSNSPYGENIFCSWTSSPHGVHIDGREPVEHWYSEVDTHIFGKEPATLRTGHFTQVVWKDSRELGVGEAKNRSGHVFVVVNYDPPGNFIGSFAENVPPIGGFPSTPKIVIDKVPELNDSSMSSSGCSDEVNDFTLKILRYHNDYRRKHGVPELKLSYELCQLAQDWAETLAREDRFAYRPNSDYGENIYCLWSSDRNAKASPKDICRSWYEEYREHNYNVEPKGLFRAGHFTQMVWKSTKELGVGTAKTRKGKVLVVCNYNPRGNTIGEFMPNVLRPH